MDEEGRRCRGSLFLIGRGMLEREEGRSTGTERGDADIVRNWKKTCEQKS